MCAGAGDGVRRQSLRGIPQVDSYTGYRTGDTMCELESWVPSAVATTLLDAPQPTIAWLTALRDSIEEYDPLVVVRPQSANSDAGSNTPDSAFDEILSHLGKEIFKLDQYQQNLIPTGKDTFSLSILNIFDECLDNMLENKDRQCSDGESTVTDITFVTSNESPQRLKSSSSSSSIYDIEIDKDCHEWTKLIESDTSDSESTCWSYKECSEGECDINNAYAAMWAQSSGFHNSDAILRRVLFQNRATVSRLSFDTADEFSPQEYNVYALPEPSDRCPVTMSPARPSDDYEPVRDALTGENIYEEIEFGGSYGTYTDEGCSCGTSVEVETCSMSASSGRDSPLYANLRDNEAYAVSQDVIFWKNLLLDPYYNDDEEDEWITPEECAVYSREQRPPLVIPRITQYRPPRQRQPSYNHAEDNGHKAAMRYERLGNWSPTSECHAELERRFTKDAPPFSRINKRLGGSTENLLVSARRPNHLQVPASSSGDSLDIEIRERDVSHGRRKTMSMMAPKKVRSPVPAPRMFTPQTVEASVLLEGPVKRTKFFEGGKKSKKNWAECYMLLTHTALYFYKDQRTYHASRVPRNVGTPPSPSAPRAELVLALRNAIVSPCKTIHTRRHTRSLVLAVDHDQYLIQDETEEGAKRWLQAIQSVIYTLYPPMTDSPTSHYQSSNTDLESLGRTPPVSRNTRSKQKDEPVFGRNLEEVCPMTSPRVPEFVVACVREIESCEDNMCTDGLYRASGNLSQVQKIRLEIDQNNLSVIHNNNDIHVLTGSLKLFFRELKEPLIPCTMFDRVLAACSIKPKEAKIREFRDIVQSLPQCNRDTLKFLLEHLIKVTHYSEKNRMHTANLAIVFGPTLLWAPAEQAHNIAVDCIQQNNVVDILLNDFKEIFQEDAKGKKKS